MHAGASGVVQAQRVMNGEVGVAILHRRVPGRSAVVSAECRNRMRERHVPFHSVRESSATLRLVSWVYGAAGVFRVEYHVCTRTPHKVTRTGPVLSVKRTSQTVFESLVPLHWKGRFRGDAKTSFDGSSRGLGSPYTNLPS